MSTLLEQAPFLHGGISARYLSMATATPFMPRRISPFAMPSNSQGVDCSLNQHIPACKFESVDCTGGTVGPATNNANCPTREFVCGATDQNRCP